MAHYNINLLDSSRADTQTTKLMKEEKKMSKDEVKIELKWIIGKC